MSSILTVYDKKDAIHNSSGELPKLELGNKAPGVVLLLQDLDTNEMKSLWENRMTPSRCYEKWERWLLRKET